MWMGVMTLLLALGTVQAVGKARRHAWYEAGASFFGTLGSFLMVVGAAEWHNVVLSLAGTALVPAGFALDAVARRRRRAAAG